MNVVSNIPPLDLKRQYQAIGADVSAAVLEVLASGAYIGGSVVRDFEQQFASYVGTTECVGCNSGTDALYLALRAMKIGAGDEVITTPFTFIATAETISEAGAKPVFVDIDLATFNLDLSQLAAAITPRTRAIMPVHLFGNPLDLTKLMSIATQHNLIVIEDCAQATGAKWNGKQVGSIGHFGCFSFFPTKNLGACGDGGAITVNDPALAADLRMYREHGSRQRYYHEAIGVNSRLDAIQAAVLQVKLQHLDRWNQQRAKVAAIYQELLANVPNIITPQATPGGESAWNQYTIRLVAPAGIDAAAYRDRVRASLLEVGVISMIYYPLPLHLQEVYRDLHLPIGSFPNTELVSHQVLSIPMFPEITFDEQQRVVYALKDAIAAHHTPE
ncbi:DegT/DnrJ/EryC1/StrS aminotransferase family protein [Chamaesiphon sp. GL140_3_metabinner_50]|uniref:DegT/DnrJ/EryC1/StrS family aminotransferase n=1 Tax=Chamaesiphon sp. GL140_3_metabinner_50 TaxID=2970812 RepID=UPI0025D8BB9F|nr:DegT/DnrJ/EryC1/StrS family aminotransferase [Chamaesiphon sp. GL140_3_metabinner_50]